MNRMGSLIKIRSNVLRCGGSPHSDQFDVEILTPDKTMEHSGLLQGLFKSCFSADATALALEESVPFYIADFCSHAVRHGEGIDPWHNSFE